MCRYLLSEYWAGASGGDRKEFRRLLGRYIIASFGPVELTEGSQTVIMAAGELGHTFGLFDFSMLSALLVAELDVLNHDVSIPVIPIDIFGLMADNPEAISAWIVADT